MMLYAVLNIYGLAVLIDVRQAAEVASDAYRPVQGSRLQLNLVDDFIDQLQRLGAHQ